MSKIRLQKFISESGIASRRAAEELIVSGKVKVNGTIVTELGVRIDPEKDEVRVRNHIAKRAEKGILLFYKPKGVVSTLRDPEGRKCLSDFLTQSYRSYYPVGRLDWDSTGLVVLTNDGELAERLLHPRFGHTRVYQVRISGVPTDKVLKRIERGVRLKDGLVSAEVKLLSEDQESAWLEVVISEGRNRIIRRLFEHLRLPVLKLKRLSLGPFKIGKLKPGQIKRLTTKEYRAFRDKIVN